LVGNFCGCFYSNRINLAYMKSPLYSNSYIYTLGLILLHKGTFFRRYRHMAAYVHDNESVLEPGCGPAIFAKFLPKSVAYRGFDANGSFIDHAAQKGLNVVLGNALDPASYSPADVVMLCDVLHHLPPSERQKCIAFCWQAAKRLLIICEEGRPDSSAGGPFYWINKKWCEFIEKDGTNNPKFEEVWTKGALREYMEKGFDVVPSSTQNKIKEVGEDLIITYSKGRW